MKRTLSISGRRRPRNGGRAAAADHLPALPWMEKQQNNDSNREVASCARAGIGGAGKYEQSNVIKPYIYT